MRGDKHRQPDRWLLNYTRLARVPLLQRGAIQIEWGEVLVIREQGMPIQPHMLPAFAAILATIAAGIFHVSSWAAVAGACVLAVISLTSAHGSFTRYGYAGSSISTTAILVSTTLNAAAAAGLSFAVGRAIGWCWGF